MPKDTDSTARPSDDPQQAIDKSGTVDTRIPEGASTSPTPETLVAGAPAAYIPQMGTGLSAAQTELGEGERVLEMERKAQRAGTDIQRG